MNNSCPICSSDTLETTKTKEYIPVIYGDKAIYDKTLNKCLTCEEEGDFFEVNDAVFSDALNKANKKSISDMVNYLAEKKISASCIERSLNLPARTISRWKTGDFSAASIALLRIIRTYPWIIEVADEKYNESIASIKVVENAVKFISNKYQISFNAIQYSNFLTVELFKKPYIYKNELASSGNFTQIEIKTTSIDNNHIGAFN